MQQYTYLAINFFSIIVCFLFSFHPKIRFHQHFQAFLKSSSMVALPFLIWDAWFTKIGVWWFNDDYLLGIRWWGLPFEEILFFICIPFACVFTYFCLNLFFTFNFIKKVENWLVWLLIIGFASISILFYDKIYTFCTFAIATISIIILKYVLKIDWLSKATFVYLLLLPGFFAVNGLLTGTGLESPIVNYNPNNFMNIRILTIPIEDSVYGYVLILWNLYFFKKFKNPLSIFQ